jgi:aspartate 1-decarboxylase
MADTGKSLRNVLLGTLQSAVVTRADLDGPDGVSLDSALLDAAGFVEHEKVDLVDLTNGSRLAAPVTAAARGSAEVAVGGAVAQLVRPGDLVTLSAFGWMKEKQVRKHAPRIIKVDAQNRPGVTNDQASRLKKPTNKNTLTPEKPQSMG